MKFELGNKIAEKYTEEKAIEVFETVYNEAQKKDCLSMQEAIINSKIRSSTFYYLIEKFPVLESIKKDCEFLVLARINKGALIGDYNPTAGIWRMKQLGEKDTQHQDITTKGDKIKSIEPITWADASNKK